MPINQKRRQSKQEQRTAKRKHKRQLLVKEKHAGLPERLASAAEHPVVESWAGESLWTNGIGNVGLSRELGNGSVAFAVFLIDRYCLGVKNAFARIESRSAYNNRMRQWRQEFPARPVSPETVRKFVEEALAYAWDLGLQPHADYQTAKLLFGDLDAKKSTETLEFGENGKPFFCSGPTDTPERCRRILAALEQKCGAGGFNYLIRAGDRTKIIPESLRQGE